jgi:hypothetical protein
MSKQYFKKWWAESGFGSGDLYFEFTDGVPTRQVENYGDRWFCSLKDYHPELGPGLTDLLLSESGLGPRDAISKEEFERAWQHAVDELKPRE